MRRSSFATGLQGGVFALALAVVSALVLTLNAGGPIVSAQTGPSLRISGPTNGSSVTGPTTIRVEVQNANLKAADLGDQSSQHLHYFIDIDPSTVIQAGQPIPTGRDNIIHSADTSQTLNLPAGQHSVWVVMSNVNHVPLTPGVQAQVSFTVQGSSATTPPPPAQTGSGSSGQTPGSMPRTGAGATLASGVNAEITALVLAVAVSLAGVALFRRRQSSAS